jgi:hypothetical protein
MNTQKEIYKRLVRVIPNPYSIMESGKSEAPGLMDFNLDILQINCDVVRIAISHYYKHSSGDMIADPDMEVQVNRKTETAEALTYQDSCLRKRRIIFSRLQECSVVISSLLA